MIFIFLFALSLLAVAVLNVWYWRMCASLSDEQREALEQRMSHDAQTWQM